jgi:acyl-coenzyme A thioesterase PaaI-like protein
MSFKESVISQLEKAGRESLENYFQGDPSFSPEQEAELVRLVASLHRIADQSIKLNGKREQLAELADAAEQLEHKIQALHGQRALPAYNKVFDFRDVGHTYAYSPITGRANAMAPPVFTRIIDQRVICKVTYTDLYEGPPGCVHGGIVALTWDHVLAAATLIDDARGPTANLNISYRKPTPLHQEIRYEAWVERAEGKKMYIKGQCFGHDPEGNEVILSEAKGLFINSLIREIYVTEEHLKQEIRR